ncbi:MAG: DAK2 domain-containing protein [Anaerolineae bacterium]|nr:DAK2 domain-containing protein [Anaerolineae bacterium]
MNTSLNPSTLQLEGLFKAALEAMTSQRQEINALDGYNGNHGDNMVENLRMILGSLQGNEGRPPADALRQAGQLLQEKGQGGTSQYYASGLEKAAKTLSGKESLQEADFTALLQTLLGSIPAKGYAAQPAQGDSVLDQILGKTITRAPHQTQASKSTGGILGELLGQVLGSDQTQTETPPAQVRQSEPEDDKLDIGDVLERVLPAGLAYLQAKQAGADTATAAQQALISALMGGQPVQAATPRVAAGQLIAQSMLKALMQRK